MKFMCGLHPRAKEYYKIWTKLEDTVNSYCNGIAIKVTESLEPINENVSINYPLVIQVENKELLEKFLDDYSNYLAQDSLDSIYDGLNFIKLSQEFKTSIDTNKKLTEYYLDNTHYIPIILWGVIKGHIEIKEMRFKLFPNEETQVRMSKVELRKRKFGINDFEFGMTADLSKFMKLNIKKQRYENGNNDKFQKDFILEPQDWQMYLCICYALETNTDIEQIGDIITIDRGIFIEREVYTDKSEGRARSWFNKRVRNNIPELKEKQYLLKLNKDESKYDVNIKLFTAFTNQTKIVPHLKKGLSDNKNFHDALKYSYQNFIKRK